MLRRPRFAAGTTLLLGGTLFAVAMIVSLVAAVVVRPLPFPEPERLVAVRATVQRETVERRAFSRPDFIDYRTQSTSFAAIGGYSAATITLRGAGAPRVTPAELVDADYFNALDVRPQLGRIWTHVEAAEPLAVISDRLWREAFHSDPDVIGRTITLDALSLQVAGVMPLGFGGAGGATDAWYSFDVPGAMTPDVAAARGTRWHEAIARLAPGVDVARANEELATIGRRLDEAYPESNEGNSADVLPLRDELLGDQRSAVIAAAGGVAVLLVIAMLNLGGLAVVRSSSRRLEHAVRRCLGASTGRLHVGTALEGAAIGAAATLVALGAAWLLLGRLRGALPLALPGFVDTALTPGVAALVAVAGIGSGIVAFLGGALVARGGGTESLRGGARTTRRGGLVRRGLVGAEIALGTVLLAVALMLARSFVAIHALDPGYRVDDIAVLDYELPTDRYDPAAGLVFGERLLQAARETSGVEAAALSSDTPLSDDASAMLVTSDRLEAVPIRVYRHAVTPSYFETNGIALVDGATFADAGPVVAEPAHVVVSEKLARALWGDVPAVGRRLKRGGLSSDTPWLTVVGVASETRWRGLPNAPTADPDVFFPLSEAPRTAYALSIRTKGDPLATAQRVAQRAAGLDGEVPLYDLETMRERVRRATQVPRFLANLGLAFASVALLLAGLGVYAIAALEGAQRVRELAIRQAVGANAAALARLFVGDYGRVFVVAALLGVLAVVPASAALERWLFGVGPADPWSLTGAIAAFALALALGVAAPLRRVLNVEPGMLMRAE
ncbi:MAG TPA: ABC transporter permease [Candidatus Saccharimonadia bacterium]|nr:ABC transporter permease [Candidatus Saccharimonadia bacterium]